MFNIFSYSLFITFSFATDGVNIYNIVIICYMMTHTQQNAHDAKSRPVF